MNKEELIIQASEKVIEIIDKIEKLDIDKISKSINEITKSLVNFENKIKTLEEKFASLENDVNNLKNELNTFVNHWRVEIEELMQRINTIGQFTKGELGDLLKEMDLKNEEKINQINSELEKMKDEINKMYKATEAFKNLEERIDKIEISLKKIVELI